MKAYYFLMAWLFFGSACSPRKSAVAIPVSDYCRSIMDPLYFIPAASKAYHLLHFNNETSSAENILKENIQKFKSSLAIDSFVIYSTYYLLFPDISNIDSEFTKTLVEELQNLTNSIQREDLKSLMHFALNGYYYQSRNAVQSFNQAHKINSNSPAATKDLRILSAISLARANELAQDYKSALSNLFNAYYISEEIQIDFYIRMVLNEISSFYIRNNLHEKAYEYKLMELNLFGEDSLSFQYANLVKLECIRRINKDGSFNFEDWKKIVDYSIRNHVQRLTVYCFAFLRTSYLDADKATQLYKIYTDSFPDEFQKFKSQQYNNYLRLMATYYESSGRIDSANYYFNDAINNLNYSGKNPGHVYSLYIRYGDFQLKLGNQNKALDAYTKAFHAANQLNIAKHQLIAAEKLRNIYQAQNQDSEPLKFIQFYQVLLDKVDSISHDREIVKMEIDNGEQILKLQKRLEEEKLQHVHQNQYNLISVFIALVFLILLASVQFHVPIWIIRTLGFLAFIFLFEFFILKLDKQIHSITHEVPWKLFALKVTLFAILLPLHHWLEKKVVHYLVAKRANDSQFIKLDFQYLITWFRKWNNPD
ncbi:MAG: hypothetical protein IPM34_11555 [Saprospiraceae bacterium]|nr:hypothetical protein [Saprospiraceae bacterium]